MLLLAGVMGLGYYLDRAGKISRDGLQALSALVIRYLLPCLAFSSLVDHFPRALIATAGLLPLIGFLTFLLGMLLGLATRIFLPRDEALRNTYVFLSAVNNYGYLPLPLVYLLYGDTGVALLFFHNLGCHFFFYTIGIWLLTGGGFHWKSLKPMVNANFIALLTGLFIALIGWRQYVPATLMEMLRMLGLGAIPLILLVIGSALAEIHPRKGFPWPALGVLTFLRLMLVPAILAPLILLLPMPKSYQMLCIIVALMPCASSTPLFVKEFGGDKAFAAQAVLVTTFASLLTIPLGLAIFLP